jgi:alpha-ketoglutarate-dependent taurine dioxygenase
MTTERVHVVDGRGTQLSALSRDEKIALVREHGGLLLRGFDADSERVRELALELGCNFYNMSLDPRVRELVTKDGMVAGVLKGTGSLPLHMERGYSPLKPELVLFHMLKPSPVGGESLLCSGARVIDELKPTVLETLRTKRLKYRHAWEPEAWRGRYGATPEDVARLFAGIPAVVEHRFEGDVLHYTYVVSAIVRSRLGGREAFANNFLGAWLIEHAPKDKRPPAIYEHSMRFEDDSPISAELFGDVQDAVRRATEAHDLQAGDIVLLDNYRFMHGRNAFEGERVMHTIMADARF